MLNEKERSYIDDVCDHVRCKQAHDCIRRELGDHIEDLRDALIEQGMETEAASDAAIREMGETELVGSKMDKAYRPRVSAKLMIVFAAILALGFVFRGLLGLTDEKTVICFILGSAGFLIILKFWNIGWLFDKAWWFIAGYAVLAGLMIWFSGKLVTIGTVRIYSSQQNLHLQLLQPLAFALLIRKLKGKGIAGAAASLPYVVLTVAPTLLFEVNFAVAGLICLLDLGILLYAVAKGWLGERRWMIFGAVIGAAIVLMSLLMFVFMPNAGANLIARFSYRETYQYFVINDILQNTPFFGAAELSALSEEAASWVNGISELTTNFLLIHLASEVGTWVYAATCGLFGCLLIGAARLCLREKSMLCRVMSLSIVGVIAIQCVIYIITNLGLCFDILPLPFISYGNSSLIINMLLMGMLFCILAKGWMYSEESMAKEENRLKMS